MALCVKKTFFHLFIIFLFWSCASESQSEEEIYTPIPYQLEIPQLFKTKILAPLIPSDNPLTVEGVSLGKKLFFDKILSRNNTQSCAAITIQKKHL